MVTIKKENIIVDYRFYQIQNYLILEHPFYNISFTNSAN